tara:strand:- start:29 stop:388 length:360 start_codon:yes stop_codon:yes gene_type:complete
MGGGASKISPLGQSHGHWARFHQQLVEQALTRRAEIQEMSRRGAQKIDRRTQDMLGAIREIEHEDRAREYEEKDDMFAEDSRVRDRLAQEHRERRENRSMANEDKPPPRPPRQVRRRGE